MTWTIDSVPDGDDSVRSEYDYVIQSDSGTGLLYCTERQLRSLDDELDRVLGDA